MTTQVNVFALEAEQRAAVELAGAEARLKEYFSLGLDPGPANQAAFLKYHTDNGLQFSSLSVDRAVASLGSALQWQTSETPAAATELEPLHTLPDGTHEVSLDRHAFQEPHIGAAP